jgi:hypothetical protein
MHRLWVQATHASTSLWSGTILLQSVAMPFSVSVFANRCTASQSLLVGKSSDPSFTSDDDARGEAYYGKGVAGNMTCLLLRRALKGQG